jgi:hypothetical protein
MSRLKLFFIIYGIILCIIYIFVRTYLKYSMNIFVPIHLIILFFTGVLSYMTQALYKWENNILKYSFNICACYTTSSIMYYLVMNSLDHYDNNMIIAEIIYIILWLLVSYIGSFIVSVPFKLLQYLFYMVQKCMMIMPVKHI